MLLTGGALLENTLSAQWYQWNHEDDEIQRRIVRFQLSRAITERARALVTMDPFLAVVPGADSIDYVRHGSIPMQGKSQSVGEDGLGVIIRQACEKGKIEEGFCAKALRILESREDIDVRTIRYATWVHVARPGTPPRKHALDAKRRPRLRQNLAVEKCQSRLFA